jgi:hypothetical protein
MIRFTTELKRDLLDIYKSKRIALEGNILKIIEREGSDEDEFNQYIDEAIDVDRETRRKRLDITKQIQQRNNELSSAQKENSKLMSELRDALDEAKKAKSEAEKLRDAAVEDFDSLQKRTQFELMGLIVRSALYVIMGVGLITTLLYFYAMTHNFDTKILESSWSNMFGILLTNSFSIIGTIMGVKYATDKNEVKKKSNE